jgi:hypothetical protein
MPFINETGTHTSNQCEILVCKDKYSLEDEINSKYIWWIGYKY